MSNKTDKLNEVIAFIEANPGQSNNWYAKNNGVVSRATFFRMLSNKEIETNETALVSNETTQNETVTSQKNTLSPEWWEEEFKPEQKQIRPVEEKDIYDYPYFENDSPEERKKKLHAMEVERKKAEEKVRHFNKMKENGYKMFASYTEYCSFLDQYFTHKKTTKLDNGTYIDTIMFFGKNKIQVKLDWFAKYLNDRHYDNRKTIDIIQDIKSGLEKKRNDIETNRRLESIVNKEDTYENKIEYLMRFIPKDMDINECVKKINKYLGDRIKNLTLEDMIKNEDLMKSNIRSVIYK